MKKVGHFGTLDPFAEGVLLIALGRATKFFDFYLKKKKTYTGKIRFGYSTTTYDREGERDSDISKPNLYSVDLNTIISSFLGKQLQLPPIYSAKKYMGKAMYKYARENKEVERKPSQIEIYDFDYKIIDESTLWFKVIVSSGTYIRTIAYDIGEKTGYGAYLYELKRESVGEFSLSDAIPFTLLEPCKFETVESNIMDFNKLLPNFSSIIVSGEIETRVLNGRAVNENQIIKTNILEEKALYKIVNENEIILAIARKDEILNTYQPFIVFN
jgi:tRNA pseudouridine55 synthase